MPKQSSHQVLKNSAIEIPRVDDEDLNSSTESTNSTSLIHCIASVGNCEQVHTSVLNLIFQQAKVAGVGTCQNGDPKSAVVVGLPHNSLKSLLHLKMTESLADGPDWHLRS